MHCMAVHAQPTPVGRMHQQARGVQVLLPSEAVLFEDAHNGFPLAQRSHELGRQHGVHHLPNNIMNLHGSRSYLQQVLDASVLHAFIGSCPWLLPAAASSASSCSFASNFSNLCSETQANMQSKSNQTAHACPMPTLPNIKPSGFSDSECVAVASSFETHAEWLFYRCCHLENKRIQNQANPKHHLIEFYATALLI